MHALRLPARKYNLLRLQLLFRPYTHGDGHGSWRVLVRCRRSVQPHVNVKPALDHVGRGEILVSGFVVEGKGGDRRAVLVNLPARDNRAVIRQEHRVRLIRHAVKQLNQVTAFFDAVQSVIARLPDVDFARDRVVLHQHMEYAFTLYKLLIVRMFKIHAIDMLVHYGEIVKMYG